VAPPLNVKPVKPVELIVVLGCRVDKGEPKGALERRLLKAAELSRSNPHLPVLMSGGKSWSGVKECDAMKKWWFAHAAAGSFVLTEAESETTRENAAHVAILCEQLGYRHAVLVTCDFHMSRARALFQKFGLRVTDAPSKGPRKRTTRLRLLLREWGARALDPWATLLKKGSRRSP
jgi:uncharacterized SAM-binding protein YcdF (DUF218 family)